MNEQLIVKNFGPIRDATVDFKRVTVFIGPTGGGKSTLAKLAAIFRAGKVTENGKISIRSHLKDMALQSFQQETTQIIWDNKIIAPLLIGEDPSIKNEEYFNTIKSNSGKWLENNPEKVSLIINDTFKKFDIPDDLAKEAFEYVMKGLATSLAAATLTKVLSNDISISYIPAERVFVASIEYSWAGLMGDDIGLSKTLLEFANTFSLARKSIPNLDIPFFDVEYLHISGRDFIKIPNREEPLMLLETASGIQSVTPLLVLLEHLSRNTEQAQSFIIEEPELNLYPTAQQGLLNWLVEKCTKGENDLTITTHSPYILSHLNLLLYAYQVAEKHPERADEVAEVVPRASWINPKEFACYQVENGGVTSLVSEDLGLIDDNGLDNLSGDAADAFDNLIRLSKGVARK